MIDLSYLTEEEQEAIMTVLIRDAELKRAEEERIRKLERLQTDSQEPDSNLKYFTGEWFYEAKSNRHLDTIHGSEIILASMKRWKSAPEDSLRFEESKSLYSQGPDLLPPPKPARTWDALQPYEVINLQDTDALQVRSPRTPRHNPFNRASLLVGDPPEKVENAPLGAEHQRPDLQNGQRSASSITTDASSASSAGFRPVPKKRTFVSQRLDSETSEPPAAIAPTPRRRLQHGSGGNSTLSNIKSQESKSTDAGATSPRQEAAGASQVRSGPGFDTDGIQKTSGRSYITGEGEAGEGRGEFPQTQPAATTTISSYGDSSVQASLGENVHGEGSASRPDFSFTRSLAAEPPVSYDLIFIEKSKEPEPSTAKHELKLSTQSASPTGDEDDSITKVLDWFSRSSSDWLNDARVAKSPQEVFNNNPSSKVDIKETKTDNRERALSPAQSTEINQQARISHLKTFGEISNTGLRLHVSKSYKPDDETANTKKEDGYGIDVLSSTRIYNGVDELNYDANGSAEDSGVLPGTASPLQKVTGAGSQANTDTPGMQPRSISSASSFTTPQQSLSLSVDNTGSEETNTRGIPLDGPQLQAQDYLLPDKFLKSIEQMSPEVQLRSSNDDSEGRNSGETSAKTGISPKRREPAAIKDRSPMQNKHSFTQDSTEKDKERIKHLRSFWEQDRHKPGYYTGQPKADGKATIAKLNKRHAKSEFDLQLIGKDSESEDDSRFHQHLSGLQSNQKAEKLSPSLNQSQFNSLRSFWDEATSASKPKRKELQSLEFTFSEQGNSKKPGPTPASTRSPPSTPYRSKLATDKQTGTKTDNYLIIYSSTDISHQREVKRPSRDNGKLAKNRKDSFSTSSSRGSSFRRAQSMFSLCTDETDQIQVDISRVHSQSRKPRANTEQSPGLRRHSDETEALTPRARAFVPTDYRHYLGMTGVHSAPAPQGKGLKEIKADYDGRRASKTHQRPLSPNSSSAGTSSEAASSASEGRSNSWLSSNREKETNSAVRLALRRAEARPKNLTKSLEDISVASSPRAERRQELSVNQRSSTDASTLPSPASSLFANPEHVKNMSKSVPSFLQKELSGSVMTMYSGDFASVEVQGSIHFSIHYVQKLREFHIFVAQCKDLAAVDPKRGRSDPYVKSYLVPDKANLGKRKTSVKKKTLNPTFNEILRYRVRMEYLKTQTLILSVWHHDTFGKNSFLGEVDVDLSKWVFNNTQMNSIALKTCPTLTPPNCRGSMRLAIRYAPQISKGLAKDGSRTGEIHIWVKECKNLPLIRASIDPYVKCFVLPDTSKKSRQKTRVLQGTTDPVFNHTMVYDGIREADLTEACVELTVLDRDRLVTNLLGGLRIGAGTGRSYGSLVDWMDSTAYEVALWDRMMASPNEWVEDVLPLRWLHSTKATSK